MNQPTSFQETQKAKPFIESIMYPSRTVMDLVSILLVIWSEAAEAPSRVLHLRFGLLLEALGQ